MVGFLENLVFGRVGGLVFAVSLGVMGGIYAFDQPLRKFHYENSMRQKAEQEAAAAAAAAKSPPQSSEGSSKTSEPSKSTGRE